MTDGAGREPSRRSHPSNGGFRGRRPCGHLLVVQAAVLEHTRTLCADTAAANFNTNSRRSYLHICYKYAQTTHQKHRMRVLIMAIYISTMLRTIPTPTPTAITRSNLSLGLCRLLAASMLQLLKPMEVLFNPMWMSSILMRLGLVLDTSPGVGATTDAQENDTKASHSPEMLSQETVSSSPRYGSRRGRCRARSGTRHR